MESLGQAVCWGTWTQVRVQDCGLRIMSGGLIGDIGDLTEAVRFGGMYPCDGTWGPWLLWASWDLQTDQKKEENSGQTWLVGSENWHRV